MAARPSLSRVSRVINSLASTSFSSSSSSSFSSSSSAPASLSPSTFLRRHSSVSADELSHFSGLANSWWDPMGPSRVLHLMNPLRHEFIATCLATGDTSNSTGNTTSPPANLHYLDIGCGGGIFAESLARTIPLTPSVPGTPTRAASMTAIDPSPHLIRIARAHARTDPTVDAHLRSGHFKYLNTTLEELSERLLKEEEAKEAEQPTGGKFDMVTLFEVIEHIDPNTSTPATFLTNALRLLKPGGWLVGSTIARTFPSFLVNQVIAEAPWPVGVVPRGTHEWSKFVNPDELEGWAKDGVRTVRSQLHNPSGSQNKALEWLCCGVMYFPGLGWKMVPGSESWGNYFWAVRV
ncbi:hypothetical protein ASPZODRAFT_72401 [Penicilliopsis zonata CBS 506.65]|uniref:Ubiquinone biosynthesis O-methyltransferase, mitochondrial n=1 Tax=Penicilliopsis zonata CBS 506.65 TaxID=1073090 RepID=A0A1L9SAA6_9EURO|nr:hypothetical protein ASPZODRAFT_72401 [Penicilliopsis zonata CBS 506.65]OJJ44071.1 hypothetical protein ASPZODRAFT_72401 [Penicilliopsis zonata CBS 506.65]